MVGDVLNATKAASSIVKRLNDHSKTVYLINPKFTADDIKSGPRRFHSIVDAQAYAKESESTSIEVLDLVINPATGLKVVQDAVDVGVTNIFIQPGAVSAEILTYLKSKPSVNVHEGCVLREML